MDKTSHKHSPGLGANSRLLRSIVHVCMSEYYSIKPALCVHQGGEPTSDPARSPLKQILIFSLKEFVGFSCHYSGSILLSINLLSLGKSLELKKVVYPDQRNPCDNKTNILVTNKMLAHLLGCSRHPWDPATIPISIFMGVAMCSRVGISPMLSQAKR